MLSRPCTSSPATRARTSSSPGGQGARRDVLGDRGGRRPRRASVLRGAGRRSSRPSSARRPGASRTTSCSPRRRGVKVGVRMSKLFGIPVETSGGRARRAARRRAGPVGVLALRNRIFFRMGVRNIRRRPGRSALIVVGSMLGHNNHRRRARDGRHHGADGPLPPSRALGQADEVVAAKGVRAVRCRGGRRRARATSRERRGQDLAGRAAPASSTASRPSSSSTIAVQDLTTRQNEPRVTLFAGDPVSCGLRRIERGRRSRSRPRPARST